LETDGSQIYVDRDLQNLRGTKTEVKILLRFDRNTEFLTILEKPPTNLKGQIAEPNKTRINAFFANCYLSHPQAETLSLGTRMLNTGDPREVTYFGSYYR